jgi:hypothetical protein
MILKRETATLTTTISHIINKSGIPITALAEFIKKDDSFINIP